MSTPVEKPVALVIGAGRRVGAVVAETLATAGYRIAVHANRSLADAQTLAKKFTAAGSASIAVVADVRDEAAVQRVVQDVREHFGQINALVNCAAVWKRKPLEDATAADVLDHFSVNTLGTFLFCKHVGLIMVGQEQGGAIVNIGDWAIARPYTDYSAYFPSKGAIPTLTRTFAVELAARNPHVRVNAILPGPVLIPDDLSAAERTEAIQGTLLKRAGTPRNIADAVLFLLANDFVTGVSLAVDGGRSIQP
jgi:pteridine reductase